MVDTIRLRLYGILDTKEDTLSILKKEYGLDNYVTPEHNELYTKILQYKKSNFSMNVMYNKETRRTETLNEEEFLKIENSPKLSKHYQVRKMMRFVQEGQVKEINMRINGKYRVPSSYSDVVFSVNENGSFVDFEFSIPKYLYGHNLAEFIPQQGSNLRFEKGEFLNSFNGQAKYLHQRLNKFIDRFFSDLCGFFECDMLPNKNYVEIRRIDLCFNQYFENKDDALMYLNEQRKFMMKRQRKSANIAKSYDTSVSYVPSTGSYFKIYHKGSEYSKSDGDLKKHLEINKRYIEGLDLPGKHKQIYGDHKAEIWGLFDAKGKDKKFVVSDETKAKIKKTVSGIYKSVPYKVDFLKAEMDKVLRYEVSLSSVFFMNTYKRKLFRRNCPIHQEAFDTYKLVKNAMDSRIKEERKVTVQDRRTYKMVHDFLNRSVSLVVGENKMLERFEKKAGFDFSPTTGKYKISRYEYAHTVLGGKDVGFFSEYFLNSCVKHFENLVNHYQIKQVEPYDTIIAKIHHYNERVEERVKKYNDQFYMRTLDWRGEPLRKKNGMIITKATQLLKQSELRNLKLKTVNVLGLATILTHLKNGKSLDQIFKEMKTPSSTKSRIKADLKMFGVFEQSLTSIEDIEVRTDFFNYYWNTDGELYRSKFYVEPKMFNYG